MENQLDLLSFEKGVVVGPVFFMVIGFVGCALLLGAREIVRAFHFLAGSIK